MFQESKCPYRVILKNLGIFSFWLILAHPAFASDSLVVEKPNGSSITISLVDIRKVKMENSKLFGSGVCMKNDSIMVLEFDAPASYPDTIKKIKRNGKIKEYTAFQDSTYLIDVPISSLNKIVVRNNIKPLNVTYKLSALAIFSFVVSTIASGVFPISSFYEKVNLISTDPRLIGTLGVMWFIERQIYFKKVKVGKAVKPIYDR
jgi:hypothetical protein